ncbi:MAG TPA: nucleoside phosphorylase [Anaerolineae bacterium]|nr:nucleoside phosphorylase [Anaerolineae bacterium]
MKSLINSDQTLAAACEDGLKEADLQLGGMAVLTFSRAIVDRLDELCGLEDAQWLGPRHHPYAACEIVKRGVFEDLDVTVLVPPMGASPLACVVEDLAACGVKAVFLACASWSLGSPVEFGDLIIPAYSVGLDGTSMHYGNAEGEVHAAPEVVEALRNACATLGVRYHVGGNASCEALYRITPAMVEGFRARGCLCMENGEASTVIAATRALGIYGGILFQPYIDLTRGWDASVLRDECYRTACWEQAEVVMRAGRILWEHRFGRGGSTS